jgi:hypothetical protein
MLKSLWLGPYIFIFYWHNFYSDVGDRAYKCLSSVKKMLIASIFTYLYRQRKIFLLTFTLLKSGFCSVLKIIFLELLATVFKISQRCRERCLKLFGVVDDST